MADGNFFDGPLPPSVPTSTPAASPYPTNDAFRAQMDALYGAGNWVDTGDYRTPQREAQLAAQGAGTVAPGHTSAHSLGSPDAPGAHDIQVRNMPQESAATMLSSAGLPITKAFAERAQGGQGAHVHVQMAGQQGGNFFDQPPATSSPTTGGNFFDNPPAVAPAVAPPVHPASKGDWFGTAAGLAERLLPDELTAPLELGAKGVAAVGDLVTGAFGGKPGDTAAAYKRALLGGSAAIARGAGDLYAGVTQASMEGSSPADPSLGPTFGALPAVPTATPQDIAAARAAVHRAAGAVADPLQARADLNKPSKETPATWAAGLVGGVGPLIASGPLAPVAMGFQGADQVAQDAQQKGTPEDQADFAIFGNAGLQAALGTVPVGQLLDKIPPVLKSRFLNYVARIGLHAAGGAGLGAAMQVGTNATEAGTFDPNKDLLAGVPEQAATMALFTGSHALIPHAPHVAPAPEAIDAAAAPGAPPVLGSALDNYRPGGGSTPDLQPPPAQPDFAPPPAAVTPPLRPEIPPVEPVASAPAPMEPPAAEGPPATPASPATDFALPPDFGTGNTTFKKPDEASADAIKAMLAGLAPQATPEQHDAAASDARNRGDLAGAVDHGAAAAGIRIAAQGDSNSPNANLPPVDVTAPPVIVARPKAPKPTGPTPDDIALANDLSKNLDPDHIAAAQQDIAALGQPLPDPQGLRYRLRALGGLRTTTPDGERISVGPDIAPILRNAAKYPGLINNIDGMHPVKAAERMAEEGWFGERYREDPNHWNVSQLFSDALEKDLSGRFFHPDSAAADELARRDRTQHDLATAGIGSEHPLVQAAKLAAYRDVAPDAEPYNVPVDMADLAGTRDAIAKAREVHARAHQLGMDVPPDWTPEEVEKEVEAREAIDREARQAETGDYASAQAAQHEAEIANGAHALTADDWARWHAAHDALFASGSHPEQTEAPDHLVTPPGYEPAGYELPENADRRGPPEAGGAEPGAGDSQRRERVGGADLTAPPEPPRSEFDPRGPTAEQRDFNSRFNPLLDERNRARSQQSRSAALQRGSRKAADLGLMPGTPEHSAVVDAEVQKVAPRIAQAEADERAAQAKIDAMEPEAKRLYPNRRFGFTSERDGPEGGVEPQAPKPPPTPSDEHAPPKTETVKLANGDAEQAIIPGTEATARQAAAARPDTLRPDAPQRPMDDGLFGGPPETDLFDGQPKPPQPGDVAIPPKAEGPRPLDRNFFADAAAKLKLKGEAARGFVEGAVRQAKGDASPVEGKGPAKIGEAQGRAAAKAEMESREAANQKELERKTAAGEWQGGVPPIMPKTLDGWLDWAARAGRGEAVNPLNTKEGMEASFKMTEAERGRMENAYYQAAQEKQAQERAATPDASSQTFGSRNVVFKKPDEASAEAIRKALNGDPNQLNSGFDPTLTHELLKWAGYYVEGGLHEFADYAHAMLERFGEGVRPFLKMVYNSVRDYPAFEHAPKMTPYEAITTDVVANAGKGPRGVPATGDGVGQGGQGGPAANGARPEPHDAPGGPSDTGAGGAGAGAGGAGSSAEGGDGVPDGGAPVVGGSSGSGVRPGEPGDAGPSSRPGGGGGGGGAGGARLPSQRPGPGDAGAPAAKSGLDPHDPNGPQAEPVGAPPIPGDIAEELPELRPAQQNDVAFAERRFSNPDGHGVLFTNGTGTGKTYTGAGIIKRFWKRGDQSILVVAPTQGILNAWAEAHAALGVPFRKLEDTSGPGEPGAVIGTTYANMTTNRTLADRHWDLVVADEAHELLKNPKGDETAGLSAFRAITGHPKRQIEAARMRHREEADRVDALVERAQKTNDWHALKTANEASAAFREKMKAEVAARPQKRSKVAFLSATPFAYDKAVDLGEKYLFDYGPEPKPGGRYNSPQSARDQFMIERFGYRMRYNKLTQPDHAAKREVFERAFNTWLRQTGALSYRGLDVPYDYDRKFQLVDAGIGRQIDTALAWLSDTANTPAGGSADDLKLAEGHAKLADLIGKRFNYLTRAKLLEAIKAERVIPIIQQHLALGRKVVVFHDFNVGGAHSPFALDQEAYQHFNELPPLPEVMAAWRRFRHANGYLDAVDAAFSGLKPPVDTLARAFPDAMFYNGHVPQKQRAQAIRDFQADQNGKNLIVVQANAGNAGISLHDTTGEHQRALINLGMPPAPTTLKQQEGRIYRIGQRSDAIFRYLNTGTTWERNAFASKIAERSGTVENLGMGEDARALRESIIQSFLETGHYPPGPDDGLGGKDQDRALMASLSDWDRAKAFYFGNQKGRSQEGGDYFATPEPLGLKMVQWAGIKDGDHVLEPSAGHGAIARWLPQTTTRTLIEPNANLASRARLAAPNANVREMRFEDLHPSQKYDAIVMNPPFGHAGATAVAHLEKAAGHLRNGGRIVALLPEGAARAKAEALAERLRAQGIHHIADVSLPASTFERAGTKVRTHVMVFEKQTIPRDAELMGTHLRTYHELGHHPDIESLFDGLENTDLPDRIEPSTKEQISLEQQAEEAQQAGGDDSQAKPDKTSLPDFETSDHPDAGAYMATPTKGMSRDAYSGRAAIMRQYGGRWVKKDGVTPEVPAHGFRFDLPEHRNAFVKQATTGEATKFEGAQATNRARFVAETANNPRARTRSVPVARFEKGGRVADDEYQRVAGIAAKHGGRWAGFYNVRGFHFDTPEDRDRFIAEAHGAAPDRLAQVAPSRRDFLAGSAAGLATAPEALARATTPIRDPDAFRERVLSHDATGAAQWIAENSKNAQYRALAGKLLRGGLDGIHIDVIAHGHPDYEDMDGVKGDTDVNNGRVRLRDTGDPESTGLTEETALHELLHAYVAARYRSLSTYLDENRQRVGFTKAQAGDPAVKAWMDTWNNTSNALTTAFPDEKARPVWAGEMARSPDEALSWALTSPEAQTWLRTHDEHGHDITDPQRKSLWSRVVDFVGRLLGIDTVPKTALSKLLDAGHAVIDHGALDHGDFAYAGKIADFQAKEGLRGALDGAHPQRLDQLAPGGPEKGPYAPPVASLDDESREAPKASTGLLSAGRNVLNKVLGEGAEKLGAKARDAVDGLLGDHLTGLRDAAFSAREMVSPLSTGSAMAKDYAKTFANTLRAITYEWGGIDRHLVAKFTPADRKAMWEAADEDSVIRQRGGEPGEGQGLNKLAPDQRAMVDALIARSQKVFGMAKALGMTDAEGLPSYVPRMVVAMMDDGRARKMRGRAPEGAGAGATNLITTTANLRRRKYLEANETEAAAQKIDPNAIVVKDIRTLGLATGRLERAIAGRRLIEGIKSATDLLGSPAVHSNWRSGTFTLDHPAFRSWRADLTTDERGKSVQRVDQNGRKVWTSSQYHIDRAWEGPLKAVFQQETPKIVTGLMQLKGHLMSIVMLSPLMHNAVIWGKAIPADPVGVLTGMAYFRGHAAKNDPAVMREAIQYGLDPVGRRNAYQQDITGIADLREHDEDSFLAKAEKFWHGTLLWDRVGDLQMGLYQHMLASNLKEGMDRPTAGRVAADLANLYAGNLPMESMSRGARFLANMSLFSRSFTLGNLAVWKRMAAGLPGEVQAQIERESGSAQRLLAQGAVRRKAAGALAMDVAIQHVSLGLAAHAAFFLAKALWPSAAPPNPGNSVQSWVNPGVAEPGKENRFAMATLPDSTILYGRLPTGKFIEDAVGWLTHPITTADNKLSPFARLALEIASNSTAPGTPYGHPVWRRDVDNLGDEAKNVARTAWAFGNNIVPSWLVEGLGNIVVPKPVRAKLAPYASALGYNLGEDGHMAAAQAVLPWTGITVSRGAPGGPVMSEYYKAKDRHEADLQEQLPGIQAQAKLGDVAGARKALTKLGIIGRRQAYIINTATSPSRRLTASRQREFSQFATPEEKAALVRAKQIAKSHGIPDDSPFAPPAF